MTRTVTVRTSRPDWSDKWKPLLVSAGKLGLQIQQISREHTRSLKDKQGQRQNYLTDQGPTYSPYQIDQPSLKSDFSLDSVCKGDC